MGSSLADIVWSLRRGVMTLEAVAQHLTEHGRRLFPGPHPTFEANGPDRWLGTELSPAVGRNVLMIGLEALHNCARHANAASVSVDFRPNGRHWIVTVSDDGRGFPEYAPPGSGFGLHTMRRRADEIGALLGVHSQPGHGTTVQLTFDPRAGDRLFHQMNIRGIVRRRRDKC
jgi:signal transduction histidine kinase